MKGLKYIFVIFLIFSFVYFLIPKILHFTLAVNCCNNTAPFPPSCTDDQCDPSWCKGGSASCKSTTICSDNICGGCNSRITREYCDWGGGGGGSTPTPTPATTYCSGEWRDDVWEQVDCGPNSCGGTGEYKTGAKCYCVYRNAGNTHSCSEFNNRQSDCNNHSGCTWHSPPPTATPKPTNTPVPTVTLTPTPTTAPTATNVPGCECNASSECDAVCPVNQAANKFTDVTYTSPMKCSREGTVAGPTPAASDKNAYCQRAARPKGDADGDGVVNDNDYVIYLRAVLGAPIAAGYNPDFNGDGIVSPSDLSIWKLTL